MKETTKHSIHTPLTPFKATKVKVNKAAAAGEALQGGAVKGVKSGSAPHFTSEGLAYLSPAKAASHPAPWPKAPTDIDVGRELPLTPKSFHRT